MAWAALGNAVYAIGRSSSFSVIAGMTVPNVLLTVLMVVLAFNERRRVHILGLVVLLIVVLSAWLPQEIAAKV
jgi:hypothetical protein